MVLATVLIPTHDNGPTIRYAIESARSQTVSDLEIFVVGDGAPAITQEIVDEFTSIDKRIRFFDFPKGPRHGEIHRHHVISEYATGKIVCYLSDDDLWLPDHVSHMLSLLEKVDFGNAMSITVRTDGQIKNAAKFDAGSKHFRDRMLGGKNFIPLSFAAHTLEIYNSLPYGWRTTPEGILTDFYMWQQLLSLPQCRAATSFWPTVIKFGKPARREWTSEKRTKELEQWQSNIQDNQWRSQFVVEIIGHTMRQQIERLIDFDKLYDSPLWKTRNLLLRIPLLGYLLRKVAILLRSGRQS